jgi:hypothetical protein
MTLRLILVSMVAALGLTIPSRVQCKRFIGLAEARASSFLAGWDTWRPGDGTGHKKLGSTATRECELCRLARVEVALRAQKQAADVLIDSSKTSSVAPPVTDGHVPNVQPPVRSRTVDDAVIASESIEIDEELGEELAFESNHQAEVIDFVGNSTGSDSTRIATGGPAPSESVDLVWVDEVCGTLIRDVRTAAMAAQPRNPAAESLASTLTGDQPVPLTVQTAADNQTEISADVASTSADWCVGYGPDLFASIEYQLSQIDQNTKLPTADEAANLPFECPNAPPSFVAPSQATDVGAQSDVQPSDIASPSIPWPIFAPEDSDSQPETRIAQEIQVPWPVFAPSEPAPGQANTFTTDSSDGTATLASPPTVAERSETVQAALTSMEAPALANRSVRSPSNDSCERSSSTIDDAGLHTLREAYSPENRWGQAVQLTREAVVAWMKVLVGPALVKVSAP